MAADNHFWMIMTVPPSAFQPSNMNLGAIIADITGLELGMAFRDGLKFELNLATKSPEAAQRMAQMITAQMQLAMATKLNAEQAGEMMRKSRSRRTATRVSFRTRGQPGGSGAQPPPNAEVVHVRSRRGHEGRRRTAPPAGTIRIYGEPGGVREIPAAPPKQP